MPKVKNVSGQDLLVLGRLVLAGQVFEVTDEQVYPLTCQDIWDANDKAAKDIHAAAVAPPAEEDPVDE